MNRTFFSIIAFVLAISCSSAQETTTPTIDLGTKRELFVDYFLIETLENVSLKQHSPIYRGAVLHFDQPWEGLFCGYITMIHDEGKYRCYYRGSSGGDDGGTHETVCVAFSDDGIHWTKPNLGIVDEYETKENNVIMTGVLHFAHNFCPMLDSRPGVAREERYKALAGTHHSGGLHAFYSEDGIHWKKVSDKAVLSTPEEYQYGFDSQNIPLWSERDNCYLCYFRVVLASGKRAIARATSKDFLHWENIQEMEVIHDNQTAPFEQFYTNQTGVYFRAPHIHVATPARFMESRRVLTAEQAKAANVNPSYFNDCSDAVFLTNRNGNRYDRTFMEAFIRPGIGLQNWVSRTNYPACNILPTSDHEMSIYVNANYAAPNAELRRYTLRWDGFASLNAPYDGGTFVSKPLTFSGNQLSLNFSTSAAGGIKVQLEKPDGTPIPGFTLDECHEIIGDEIDRKVVWNDDTNVSALAGEAVRLRFVMKDADVYSFRFE